MFDAAFSGKTVWITGHTGFKGAWLAHWLLELGANVRGFALAPPTTPALFDQLGLADRLHHEIADIRDAAAVRASLQAAQPDYVLHLAAQPLVRHSYAEPVETYATNVMGTVHVLDALRGLKRPCAAVLVTTDKCYENREWRRGYHEEDMLGGHDPYSSSKAAAEIAIASYRRAFFRTHPVRIASARAGNVIGGGDWALDRIVPDCARALQHGDKIRIRNPHAVRPWQHVVEPLSGYLWLAARLAQLPPEPSASGDSPMPSICSAFNFGPGPDANRTVAELVTEVLKHWSGTWEDASDAQASHEATLLQLAIEKARTQLQWWPAWSFGRAVEQTVGWYRQVASGGDVAATCRLTSAQIAGYVAEARALGLPWAVERP
ncbi:MAG: CDP-glucose 4,6-dehydratase [Verrucomicrobia bacterium]|nr:CDP-glucose 4,6-dehydratase [Verrucomicrobiota bacterium]